MFAFARSSKKVLVKTAALALLAMAVMPAMLESSANAWPSVPSPPQVNIPAPPPPPLPPFNVSSTTFENHAGNSIEKIPASGCNENHDTYVIRGQNVGVATSFWVDGAPISASRLSPQTSGSCLFPNCTMVWVEVKQQTQAGPRTINLKAPDGRILVATFDVKANTTNRCDAPIRTAATSSGSSGGFRGTTSSGTSSSNPPAQQQQPAVARASTSRSKTCQGSTLQMSNAQTFTINAAQTVKVNVSFQAFSPCWCPSTPNQCPQPAAGSRQWVLRRTSDNLAITVPWQSGESSVPNVPAGTWIIELNEGSVPPGSYSVTYTL